MKFNELAFDRYSVRKFNTAKGLEKEKLDYVLKAALLAPTAGNNQPWRIIVAASPEALERAEKCTQWCYGAPVVLLICYDEREARTVNNASIPIGVMDATIAAVHIMLSAADIGLGTCFVGDFDEKMTASEFALEVSIHPVAFIPIGYADCKPGIKHSVSKKEEDLIIFW